LFRFGGAPESGWEIREPRVEAELKRRRAFAPQRSVYKPSALRQCGAAMKSPLPEITLNAPVLPEGIQEARPRPVGACFDEAVDFAAG